MMMPAFTTSAAASGMPFASSLYRSIFMISAPISVPTMYALPPVNAVPPTATAAMASSSEPRPITLASDEELTDIDINPASPASAAHNVYAIIFTRAVGMPLKYAACSLPPVTSKYWPNNVLRTIHANNTTSASIRNTCAGTPATRPSAIHWNAGLSNACKLPSVNTCAMSRPAMNSTSVATMGCTESLVTRKPLNTPQRAAAMTGKTKANAMPNGPATFMKIIGASDLVFNDAAPTEKSIPPVATTSVIL